MCSSDRSPSIWLHPYFAATVSAGSSILSSWLLRHAGLSSGWRLVVALLAVPPSIYLMFCMFRWVRSLDELQRRIQAEALALAFTGAMLLALTVQYLQKAGYAMWIDWDFAWGAMIGLYLTSMLVVSRRYA